jgi:hypothetical protein
MSCSDGRQYIKGAIFITGRLFTAGAKRQVKAEAMGKSRSVRGFVSIDFIEH